MNADRWERIQDLYHGALERPRAQRDKFLAKACRGDGDLRREVESLLSHETAADSLLESPVWEAVGDHETTSAARSAIPPGSAVGMFRIVGLLGSGGMGEVYRATDTSLGRDVALKILPPEVAGDPARRSRFKMEARAAAALCHPNICTVYGVEEHGDRPFIVMEMVEGETLAARLERGPLPLGLALSLAVQIAGALSEAHGKGVVHRDLKPANIMIGKSGAKVLDFGLAKIERGITSEGCTHPSTEKGMILGTVQYMSPEQARGKEADARSDLFSFGLVLYEMITAERAFSGNSPLDVCGAILHSAPRGFGDARIPAKLQTIVRRLIEKDPVHRYPHADAVHKELAALETSLEPARPMGLSRNAQIAVGVAVVLASVAGAWQWRRSSRERWALETASPEIARLLDAGEYTKAASLTREARIALPKDATLEKLWTRATGEVSIASVPPGAEVSIRPYAGDPNAWEPLGKTPLRKIRIPLNVYLWKLVKPGYATSFIIGEAPGVQTPGFHSSFDQTLKLRPAGSVPPGMVVVPGVMMGLAHPLEQAPPARIDDFLIDRHEVTNQEYKKFVEAGGYQRREFWKEPFVRDGRPVPWEDAVDLFRDATGRPGPATWEVGDYPRGHENHPVAGVSWYEAAAYADFAGKSLPTAYHWTRASQARNYTAAIAAGSNFRQDMTQPVGGEGTLSGFGTTDMAGNVKEWCWNEAREAKRVILGGGFGEPNYMFNHTDVQSPWARRANFGFRCVKLDSPRAGTAAARIEVTSRDYWKEKPASVEVFKVYSSLYAYDKGELNAQLEKTASMDAWTRTRVTLDAAYGNERVIAYIFLPRNMSPPYQAVVYFPGAFAFLDDKLDLSSLEDTRGFLLKSGRALIVPIYKGMYERRDGLVPGGEPRAFFRDHVIAWSKDLGRVLDYLETRKDIDSTKLAYFGDSLGGAEGPLLLALETRIKAAILSSGGFQLRHDLPEVDPFNFAARVTTPVLMLSGRYDASFPLESSQRPLFRFLGTPANDKKQVIYEDGHGAFPRPGAVRESLDWLDRYLGPVRR